jgi:diguanylate cyclase
MTTLLNLTTIFSNAFLLKVPGEFEVDQNNLRRILIMSYIMVPVHLAQIFIFYRALTSETLNSNGITVVWRLGIIYAHLSMLILVLIAGFIAIKLYRQQLERSSASRILTAVVAFLYLLFGAVVCIIDQLVTSSINPYLISSMAVGLVIVMHPYLSLIYYPLIYTFFHIMLPLTQKDPELISTVRVNGISAAAIGMGLALIIWRTSLLAIIQKNIIEQQKVELLDKNQQLEQMARTDMMTGLANRICFTEQTELEMARTRRAGNVSSVVLLDLDSIKIVNDRYGHPVGDQVLTTVADIIKNQLRSIDLAARFGGDEFALLLPDTDLKGAIMVAEKIRLAISGYTFADLDESLKITASFGVAPLKTGVISSFNSVYHEADKALYRAKEKGRNRVEC